jgi:hypothetical protein
MLQPKSLEVYRFLGLLPALEAKSSAQRELRSYDPQDGTKVISTKTMMEEDEPTPAYPYVSTLLHVSFASHAHLTVRR